MTRWPFETVPIPRVHTPSPSRFKEQFLETRQPVILEGVLDSWPALSHWSLPFLVSEVGDRPVVVYSSADRFFPGGKVRGLDGEQPEDGGRRFERMRFAEFAERLEHASARWHYLYQFPVALLDRLLADCKPPPYLPPDSPPAMNLWVGDAGCITPAHFDQADNFFCQISGEKEILLFDPDQGEFLYPHASDDLYARQSRVFDLELPDPERFKNIRRLRCRHAVVGPGDLLFIPMFYWHAVYTRSRAISVNYFCWDVNRFGPLIARWQALVADALTALPDDLPESMKRYVLRSLV